jgi:hypothetical protein
VNSDGDTTRRKRLARPPTSNATACAMAPLSATSLVAGRRDEIFLFNHTTNAGVDVGARDATLVNSIALQHGADVEVIRRALCRDSQAQASSLCAALHIIAGGER